MFSGGLMLARGPALPLTLPPETCAHKNDHARTKTAPPTDLKSRGKKGKTHSRCTYMYRCKCHDLTFSFDFIFRLLLTCFYMVKLLTVKIYSYKLLIELHVCGKKLQR